MKYTILGLIIAVSCLPPLAQAQNNKDKAPVTAIISEQLNIKIKANDGITIVTIPGQNTNGEELKCAIYEAFSSNAGAGGISCNWVPATYIKR